MAYNSSYNYSRLKGKITEKYGSNAHFAHDLGLTEHTLSLKLNNLSAFRQDEIEKSVLLLGISKGEIADYFFSDITSRM